MQLKNRPNEWKLVVACDPATTSTFGVLLTAFSLETGQFMILDEIYEKDRSKMHSQSIWLKVMEKKAKYAHNKKWVHIYDEAGAWFANEVRVHFSQGLIPTQKTKLDKERGLSLMRELMIRENSLFVNQDCKNFIYELENYFTDEHGNIPKEHDHVIDCCRYSIQASNVRFTFDQATKLEELKRGYTIEQDMLEDSDGEDFYDFLTEDFKYLC
jgi:hypothetical protein